ncbi:tyrosine-type recombinase/integrase [Virgibacillus dakarensis]|uniref:tyrosine-type recombinase/integrase n=1 Tax=Virgibacillus dakarensis TaxID=1917889 RepID=UPI000B44DB9B|nr:tyrosine-type recombinase/integrase [Virgibacillus dakarensis]
MRLDDKLDDLFKTFYSIKVAEGRSERTLGQYQDNYSYFVKYLDKRGIEPLFSNLDRTIFRDYITYMRNEIVTFEGHKYKTDKQRQIGLAPSTINTRLKTLRTMFTCLYEEEITASNPTNGVKNLPNPLEEIEVLTLDELKRLLKTPDRSMYAGFRDHTLMYVLIDGLMRISEATNLKERNFDLKHNTVTIPASIAKSRKPRTLPLRPATTKLVKRLIAANGDFNSEYVFLTNYGEPIDRDQFRKRLNEYGDKAKIKKNIHPHLLRHTAATLFLEDGGSIRHLQMLLGHADLRMVLRYTHLSNEAVQNEHTKHSPINKVADKLSRPRKTRL